MKAMLTQLDGQGNCGSFFAVTEIFLKILQFTLYLISRILDFLKRKWTWYTTSNIQQIAIILRHLKNALQNAVTTVKLFHVHKQMEIRNKTVNSR
jgi:hypothetical protein